MLHGKEQWLRISDPSCLRTSIITTSRRFAEIQPIEFLIPKSRILFYFIFRRFEKAFKHPSQYSTLIFFSTLYFTLLRLFLNLSPFLRSSSRHFSRSYTSVPLFSPLLPITLPRSASNPSARRKGSKTLMAQWRGIHCLRDCEIILRGAAASFITFLYIRSNVREPLAKPSVEVGMKMDERWIRKVKCSWIRSQVIHFFGRLAVGFFPLPEIPLFSLTIYSGSQFLIFSRWDWYAKFLYESSEFLWISWNKKNCWEIESELSFLFC